jgi:hypothetical protein
MTLRLHHAKEPVRFIALIDRQPSSWVRRPRQRSSGDTLIVSPVMPHPPLNMG